jgi:uncharacterized OB-fold protein
MKHTLIYKDYHDALKDGRILGVKCASCGTITTPPKMVCPKCAGEDLAVTTLEGRGRIRTFTTVFVAAEGRESEVPYVIVIVELDEGSWIMGNLDGIDPKEASMDLIGKAVTMSGNRLFPGDAYSAGEGVRPVFVLA